jgi:DsbC/DsbD-like thiol-disulfide interchange protein
MFPTMLRLLPLLLLATPVLATTQDEVLFGALLPGWQMEGGAHMAALRLDLAPGWKTYWRSPGDAGIPPRFDWSGSTNLRAVRLHWPAPDVFHLNGMQSIGYYDQLVLPVEVVPLNPALPVRLAVTMELGICDDICLPAALSLAGDLTPPGAPDPSIAAALARGATPADQAGVTAVACDIAPIADGLRLTARVRLPDPGQPETVAFETADRSVWVAEAATERRGPDLVAVTELVPAEGAPFALDRAGVTLTILTDSGAVEVRGCPAP